MRYKHTTWMAIVLIAALQATVVNSQDETASATSETIAAHAFGEQEGRVGVVVGSAIADTIESDEFLPLQVAVAVRTEGPELVFGYNSFALMDAAGNVHRVADPKAVSKNRKLLGSARRFGESRAMPLGAFIRDSAFVPSEFYNKDGTLFRGAHLSRGMHTQDILFFPRPEAGIGGVMTLSVLTEGMEKRVEVRFEVPGKKKKG